MRSENTITLLFGLSFATIEQLTWSDWLSQVWVDKDFQISMMNFFTLWESDFLYYSLWNSEGAFNYRKISNPDIDDLTLEMGALVFVGSLGTDTVSFTDLLTPGAIGDNSANRIDPLVLPDRGIGEGKCSICAMAPRWAI